MKPARWRKVRVSGFARLGECDFELWRGRKHLATVSRCPARGWYWYGGRTNTLADGLRFETADDAKADVRSRLPEIERAGV